MLAIWPSISANYSLVLLLHWSFDCKQVKELDLLVAELVAVVFSQLGLLFIRIIFGPEAGWIV